MSNGSSTPTTLQNQWYNTLAAKLAGGHDFQIIQPNAVIATQATDDQIWRYFNAIPPAALNNNLTLSGGNQFYTDYAAVLSQLTSNALTTFQNVLGAYYPLWQRYLASLSPMPALNQLPSTFYSWAVVNAPSVAGPGRSALAGALLDPIFNAQTLALNTSSFVNNTPNFTQGVQQLFQQLPNGNSLNFNFDSQTASSDVTDTWCQGSAGLFFGVFGPSDGATSQLTQQFASSHVTASINFQSVVTFVTDPPGPPNGWYSSAALSMAYNASGGGAPWVSNANPNWNSTFGPSGNLQRFVGSVIVGSGMTVTVTSDAQYSASQQTQIQESSSGGFWPFYWASGSSSYTNTVTFNSNQQLQYTMTSGPSSVLMIGANVLPIEQYIGGNSELTAFAVPLHLRR